MAETTIEIDRDTMKETIGWCMVDYAREHENDSDVALEFLTEGRRLIEESRQDEQEEPGVLDNYES